MIHYKITANIHEGKSIQLIPIIKQDNGTRQFQLDGPYANPMLPRQLFQSWEIGEAIAQITEGVRGMLLDGYGSCVTFEVEPVEND